MLKKKNFIVMCKDPKFMIYIYLSKKNKWSEVNPNIYFWWSLAIVFEYS